MRLRDISVQTLILALVLIVVWGLGNNLLKNLAAQGIRTGFDFWNVSAGFNISQTLVSYVESDTYGRVFLVGLLNTLVVALCGIVLATLLGFTVGIAALSRNPLLTGLCRMYVEGIRNIPLLFHILFIYTAVLKPLPNVDGALSVFWLGYLSNRGLQIAWPVFDQSPTPLVVAIVLALCLAYAISSVGRSGSIFREGVWVRRVVAVSILVALPWLTCIALGISFRLEWPEKTTFNFIGGANLLPEFVALLSALGLYFSSYIAEIVRGGLLAVPKGQSEAALAIGLQPSHVLRLITVPLALRSILPPLTNQYLNLIKASSLGAAIGYPDLVAIFAGTALNQTGQSVEIIAITMGCYLLVNLVGSLLMNAYNRHTQLGNG